MARKFKEVSEFEIGDETGSVHVSEETGAIRIELPGRYWIESVFPGVLKGDAMNITVVPTETDTRPPE
jgi:hypothetical protein